MTGYTVHTGSTEKFSQGWDQIFGKSRQKKQGEPQVSQQTQKSSRGPSTGADSSSQDSDR